MRFPLVVDNDARDATRQQDAWGTNSFIEKEGEELRAVKRPGTATAIPGIGTVLGQGLFNFNNQAYAIENDALWGPFVLVSPWDSTTSYSIGAGVSYQGQEWIATTPVIGVPPPSGWTVISYSFPEPPASTQTHGNLNAIGSVGVKHSYYIFLAMKEIATGDISDRKYLNTPGTISVYEDGSIKITNTTAVLPSGFLYRVYFYSNTDGSIRYSDSTLPVGVTVFSAIRTFTALASFPDSPLITGTDTYIPNPSVIGWSFVNDSLGGGVAWGAATYEIYATLYKVVSSAFVLGPRLLVGTVVFSVTDNELLITAPTPPSGYTYSFYVKWPAVGGSIFWYLTTNIQDPSGGDAAGIIFATPDYRIIPLTFSGGGSPTPPPEIPL